jgi:hypothetical protein
METSRYHKLVQEARASEKQRYEACVTAYLEQMIPVIEKDVAEEISRTGSLIREYTFQFPFEPRWVCSEGSFAQYLEADLKKLLPELIIGHPSIVYRVGKEGVQSTVNVRMRWTERCVL